MNNKPKFREIAAQFINPTVLGTDYIKKPYILLPLLPVGCFLLFGLQLMLERFRAGAGVTAATIPVICTLLGVACAYSAAAVIFAFSRLQKDTTSYRDFLCYTCIAFSGTAIFEIFGLIQNFAVFADTSANFGVAGFVWLLIPFMAIAKYIFEEKTLPVLLCSGCAAAVPFIIWGAISLYGGTIV